MNEPETITQFNIRIPDSLLRKFKAVIQAEGKTYSEVLEVLIERHVGDLSVTDADERLITALRGLIEKKARTQAEEDALLIIRTVMRQFV